MSGLTSEIIILSVLIIYLNLVSGTSNNTTQFDNFTIEWENFSILTCAVPTTINVSLFNCLPSPQYTDVADISCLEETNITFDQSICQATSTAFMYTSSTSVNTQQLTTMQTSTVLQAQTSTGTTTITTTTTATTKPTTLTTAHSLTTNMTTQISIANTTILSSTTKTATFTSLVTTTGSSGLNQITMAENTSMSNSTTTTTTTTTAGTIYHCSNNYIGTYCNMSSDVCSMSDPCLNDASCYPDQTFPYEYYCACPLGYIGPNCEYDERSCQLNTCWHNGTCLPINATVPSYNGTNFKCQCVQGYNGIHCELKVDLCDDITCENKGICQTVEMSWVCLCLDASLYYGDYCQYKTNKLKIREILSKSFAAVAIGAIITTCTFIVIMDILKYAFHIDPVEYDRESYRRRREERKRARQPKRNNYPKVALRFQYVS